MASKTTYKDDLYMTVNGEWEQTAVIPDDKPATGGFTDLADGVEKKLMADFAAFRDGQEKAPNQYVQRAVDLYRVAGDYTRRDKEGITPLTPRLARIAALTSVDDLNGQAAEWDRNGFPLPFNIAVEPDMKDTANNVVYLYALPTILPDTTYYADDNPAKEQLLAAYREMATGLLRFTDLDAAAQAEMVEAALRFDTTIAAHVKSNEDKADYPAMYNPTSRADITAKMRPFAWDQYLQELLPSDPDQIIVTDPGFLDAFATIYNNDTFADFRAWAYVNELIGDSTYLSEELRQLAGTYRRKLTGLPALPNQDKSAYRIANSAFSEPVGIYYGRKYFGEEAKGDVIQLVQRMIATYKQRIADNPWMSQPTKDKAIVKLNTMVLKMGYPDKVNARYDHYQVDPDASLLENMLNINQASTAYSIAQLDQPVDRTEWGMPGHLVNACYDPSRNDITFPAAILQAPFYSLKQTDSENFGGIGAVIAHEITHGFDNNGAQFDEFGNLKNWWQDSDYKEFKRLTQAMIDEFNGRDFAGGKVNGKLIVSENIADLGGMAAALATAQQDEDVDLRAFFTNWGRIWRQKDRPEYAQLLLASDVHAPNYLRANVQPQNFDEWYATFDVQPGDGMYLDPARRVVIW